MEEEGDELGSRRQRRERREQLNEEGSGIASVFYWSGDYSFSWRYCLQGLEWGWCGGGRPRGAPLGLRSANESQTAPPPIPHSPLPVLPSPVLAHPSAFPSALPTQEPVGRLPPWCLCAAMRLCRRFAAEPFLKLVQIEVGPSTPRVDSSALRSSASHRIRRNHHSLLI